MPHHSWEQAGILELFRPPEQVNGVVGRVVRQHYGQGATGKSEPSVRTADLHVLVVGPGVEIFLLFQQRLDGRRGASGQRKLPSQRTQHPQLQWLETML